MPERGDYLANTSDEPSHGTLHTGWEPKRYPPSDLEFSNGMPSIDVKPARLVASVFALAAGLMMVEQQRTDSNADEAISRRCDGAQRLGRRLLLLNSSAARRRR
jgi:hypothetical protein